MVYRQNLKMERALTLCAADIRTLKDFLPWDYECEEYIKALHDKCREKRRTGTIHSVVAEITRLEGVKNALRERFIPSDAGYGAQRAFAWREIEVVKSYTDGDGYQRGPHQTPPIFGKC